MNNAIATASRQILSIYTFTRASLANVPSDDLHELSHRADELRLSEEFSLRTAAEITRTACHMILEERSKK